MGIRESYQEKAHAQLCEWHTWIEGYKAGPAAVDPQKRLDRRRRIERMEDCHRLACIRLNELRASQEARWEAAKLAVEQAMIVLKHVLDESGTGQAAHFLELQEDRGYVYEPFHRRG